MKTFFATGGRSYKCLDYNTYSKKVIIDKMGKRQGRNGSAFVLSNASLKLAFYS